MTVEEGRAAADEAIARVDAAANEEWKIAAKSAVLLVAARRVPFTTDDVWEVLGSSDASTHERRAMGAIMRWVAKIGLIVPTEDYRQSARPECHSRPLRVWRPVG